MINKIKDDFKNKKIGLMQAMQDIKKLVVEDSLNKMTIEARVAIRGCSETMDRRMLLKIFERMLKSEDALDVEKVRTVCLLLHLLEE